MKVSSDATIVFPLIVSQTFFKEAQRRQLEGTTTATAAAAVVESDSEVALKTKKSRIEDHAGMPLTMPLDVTVRGEAKV